MAEEKATSMVIKVDLDCEKCRKKIKKLLCKIPEIQNQVYDEKKNTVTITVFSRCPEKIKKKICCKGGETIQGMEFKQQEPKKLPSPSKPPDPQEKKQPPKQSPEKEKPPPARKCCRECSEGHGGGPCYQGLPYYSTAVPCYPFHGRLVYYCCVGGCNYGYAGCHVGRCYCVSEDSYSSCSVM